MANIKLGSIVTDIQGSIGGTTFRRTANGHIAYNKPKKQLKSASSEFSQRLKIGEVMRKWSQLTANERTALNEQALLFQFPDKFGNLKNLTGRQLFIKLSAQLIPFGLDIDNLNNLNSFVEQPVISETSFLSGTNSFSIVLTKEYSGVRVGVRVKPKPKTGSVKPHAHFRTIGTYLLSGTDTIDVSSAVMAAFPYLEQGQSLDVQVYAINGSGFVSSVSAFDTVIV